MAIDELPKLEIGDGIMPAEPAAIAELTTSVSEAIEKKFVRLRDQWKAGRGFSSSVSKLVMHPAYQTIIGMGSDVIPLLFRELERSVDHWFWALQVITEANPVPNDARGNWRAMAKAWLAWGEEHGYKW